MRYSVDAFTVATPFIDIVLNLYVVEVRRTIYDHSLLLLNDAATYIF